jgi:hypothetical protein
MQSIPPCDRAEIKADVIAGKAGRPTSGFGWVAILERRSAILAEQRNPKIADRYFDALDIGPWGFERGNWGIR